MIVAGFDQAPKNIGWAYGAPGSIPTRGVKAVPDFGENTARLGEYVREWTTTFLKSCGANRAYDEQIIVRKVGLNVPVLSRQFKVQLSIETAAAQIGMLDDVYEVDIGDWRREFYLGKRPTKGQGTESEAWKDMALVECARRGWLVEDHNAAEACGIWWYGCCHSDRRLLNNHKVEARRAELKRWNSEAI